jgi:hypothetical protein
MNKSNMDVRQRRSLLKRPIVRVLLGIVAIIVVIALALFEPWTLWINKTVSEPVPTGAAPPTELARGDLISHEHATTGTVRVLQLADGSRVLRLENLDTTSGPALTVQLSDAAVVPVRAGWQVFDDGKHLNLGDLKGNKGSQNYLIPRNANLDDYRSASIWCDRFNVSFGAATLVGR